jgi:ribosomal protein L32
MGHFQVLFSGQVVDGANEATVRDNVARKLGLDQRKVAQLFSGRTVVIRSELERHEAEQLQSELTALGALARIKDLTPDDRAKFKIDKKVSDTTLKDITAAHVECPRCGHLQLESEFCARCGIDMATALKQKRKEDLLIEKKIRSLKRQQPGGAAPMPQAGKPALAEIQPIKRRSPAQRPAALARQRTPSAPRVEDATPASNPFRGGFWRKLLKSSRDD